ncbi:MAG: hypothetical protein ABSB49_16250 [Polyangia bacterium]|jgi:hypothetical protein
MTKIASHKWEFKARFRRHALGWRSQPAIQRVKQAVAEVKKVAKKEPAVAAEGAIAFLERVSPALDHVDSSSGAIGSAVNWAIAELVQIIAVAPADAATRDAWLERLWDAYQDDEIPYIESLGDHWGELCVSKELASKWADQLMGTVKMAWSPDPQLRGFFKGTTNCLSALLAAERYDELEALVETAPQHKMWHYRQYAVKALAAMGKNSEAIRYAESERGINDSPIAIARVCGEILLSSGLVDEAYRRYAIEANQGTSNLSTLRAVTKKYPGKDPADIINDLVASTPGEEGKWFAAAKDAGYLDVALQLASRTPCDPRTLTRAARDFAESNPQFAAGAGFAALNWLAQGYGYEVTSADVWAAYSQTMKVAERAGKAAEMKDDIRKLASSYGSGGNFVAQVLHRELGLP